MRWQHDSNNGIKANRQGRLQGVVYMADIEFLAKVLGVVIIFFGFKAVWISTLMIQEKRQATKDGTHDYYGNKIEKD